MKIVLENVQGFKGLFEFEVIDGLNNITAKLNGTGKTTFYDCLKLLTNPSIFTKEDLEFFVNKESSFCRFLVYLEDVIYGFACDRKNLVYLRKYNDDDEPEYRNSPFEEVGRKLGVFILNDTFINICDKYINLLSDSNTSLNFELIDALLSHKKLEELIAFTLTANDLRTNQLKIDKIQYTSLKSQLDNMMYYRNIDSFRNILDDNNYIDTHDTAVNLLSHLSALEITAENVDLLPINNLLELISNIRNYVVTMYELEESDLSDITGIFNLSNAIAKYQDIASIIESKEIEAVIRLTAELNSYSVISENRELNIIADLFQAVSNFTIAKPLEIDWISLSLCKLINDIKEYTGNLEIIERCGTETVAINAQLDNYRVECPIHKKVYLAGGECVSV